MQIFNAKTSHLEKSIKKVQSELYLKPLEVKEERKLEARKTFLHKQQKENPCDFARAVLQLFPIQLGTVNVKVIGSFTRVKVKKNSWEKHFSCIIHIDNKQAYKYT